MILTCSIWKMLRLVGFPFVLSHIDKCDEGSSGDKWMDIAKDRVSQVDKRLKTRVDLVIEFETVLGGSIAYIWRETPVKELFRCLSTLTTSSECLHHHQVWSSLDIFYVKKTVALYHIICSVLQINILIMEVVTTMHYHHLQTLFSGHFILIYLCIWVVCKVLILRGVYKWDRNFWEGGRKAYHIKKEIVSALSICPFTLLRAILHQKQKQTI